MSARSALKALFEAGLVRSGMAALGRVALPGDSLVLAYHNVVPDDCLPFGDRSLHLARRQFVRQVDHLLQTCSVVPLDEIVAPPRSGQRPRVAITFDDGYRGAVTLAVEELASRGISATLFIAPAFVGGGPFWWDAVTPSEGRTLDGELREQAIREQHGVPDWGMVASEQELRSAVRHPGRAAPCS